MKSPFSRRRGQPRRVLFVGLLVLALAAVVATAAGSSSASPVAKKQVFLVTCEPNVFCHTYNINFIKKMKAAGIGVTQLSDNFDPVLQDQHMNQAIAAKPAAIVVWASNADAIVPALQRAHAAGIPTVLIDARIKPAGEKYVTFEVLADNHSLGKFAAMNLVEGMKAAGFSKGRVILVTGTAGNLITQDRLASFYQYMKAYPQYKIAPAQDGNWDQVLSSQLALQLFTKYRSQGGVQGAYGMADYEAAGIIQAANQLNLPVGLAKKGLIVTGSNCTPTGWPLLQSGALYGDATQSPLDESDAAAQHVIAFLKGVKQPHTILVKEYRFTINTYKPFAHLCADWPSS